MDYLHENNLFLELELDSVSNSSTYSTNFTVELLRDGVREAELQKTGAEQSQTPLRITQASARCYL
jgi:hypothetical protein